MNQWQELVLNLNSNFVADPILINLLTGLVFVVTLLSMKVFKYTPSSKFKWSTTLYYTACILMMWSVAINRFIGYPPEYPLTSSLYLASYLFFSGYIFYAGSQRAHVAGGKHGN